MEQSDWLVGFTTFVVLTGKNMAVGQLLGHPVRMLGELGGLTAIESACMRGT